MRFIYSILVVSVFLAAGVGFQQVFSAPQDAPRISLADAKKDFDAGTAVFVDSRSENIYKEKHIKGAINIPYGEVENRWKEVPTDKKIIVYCSWPNENSSAGLVRKLQEKGIKNAFALVGGTQGWIDAGYPTENSK